MKCFIYITDFSVKFVILQIMTNMFIKPTLIEKLNFSSQKPFYQIKLSCAGMVIGWSSFQTMSCSTALN